MYIITSCISGEPIHQPLWANIKTLGSVLNADILVIANYAENPNLFNSDSDQVFWESVDTSVEKHLVRDQYLDLGGVIIRSDWNIRPKTLNPLVTARGASKAEKHQIFGHPQVSVESQPRALNADPKSLYTTGTLTLQGCDYYRRSQSERAAQFHHTYGFLVVCDGHVFPIVANSKGGFTFFNLTIGEGAARPKWSVLGDLHFPNQDDKVLAQVTRLLDSLGVKDLILHDTLDFVFGSHHQYTHRTRHKTAHLWSVTQELELVCESVRSHLGQYHLNIIQSNHDTHLDRWLSQDASKINNTDLRLYFDLNRRLLTESKSAFELAMDGRLDATFYGDFNPLTTAGILHLHGDKGVSGSRGTPTQYSKASVKICGGHTHSESILKGYMNPGCLKKLPSDYEGGLTTATQGIILIAESGKRQLVTARNGVLVPDAILEALAN
jgi:hypothetical protein